MQHATPTAKPPAALVNLAGPHLGTADNMPWHPLAGGRTNQLWRVGDRVVKLYEPRAVTPLFPNDPVAEQAAMTAFSPLGLAPTCRAALSGAFGQAIVYDYVGGPTGYSDPEGLARILSQVHTASHPISLRRTACGSDEIMVATVEMIDQLVQSVPSKLLGTVRGLAREVSALPSVPAEPGRVIHADPVGANVVNTPTGPVLIDWQCPAIGDPCEDIAMVLSPSMQLAYESPMKADAMACFLKAYPQPEVIARYRRLAPYYHLRMAGYALWSVSVGRTTSYDGVMLECDAARVALSLAGQ